MRHIHGGDIYRNKVELDYSVNINPLGVPEGVKEAVCSSLEQAVNYPDTECTKLREAIAELEQIDKEYIVCGNGAAELIYMACMAVKPQKALLIAPTFAEYEQALKVVDCEIEYYVLKEENEFHVRKDYLNFLQEDLDMVFICNPNNPTGHLISKVLLDEILSYCKKHNIIVVLDECFIDFVEGGEKYSMKKNMKEYPNLLLIKAFTKFFAMAGIRLGYGFTSSLSLREKMKETVQPWSVSVLAQAAGCRACLEGEYIKLTKESITKEREFLIAQLESLSKLEDGWIEKVFDSKANFVFIKAKEEIYIKLKEKGILIRDCSNYYGLKKGYYRIAVKSHEDNVRLFSEIKRI